MCTVLLPTGDNPIGVNIQIISYHQGGEDPSNNSHEITKNSEIVDMMSAEKVLWN